MSVVIVLFVKYVNVFEITSDFIVIKSEADYEVVRNLHSDIVDRLIFLVGVRGISLILQLLCLQGYS